MCGMIVLPSSSLHSILISAIMIVTSQPKTPDAAMLESAKQDILSIIHRNTRTTHDGRSFLLAHSIMPLLEDAYRRASKHGNPDSIFTTHSTTIQYDCRVVFCIILQLDMPVGLLPLCCTSGIVDAQLPISEEQLLSFFKSACADLKIPEVDNASAYSTQFYHEQYRWVPLELYNGFARSMSQRDILPIYRMEKISPYRQRPVSPDPELSTTLWRIQIPQEFVAQQLQEEMPQAKVKISSVAGETESVCKVSCSDHEDLRALTYLNDSRSLNSRSNNFLRAVMTSFYKKRRYMISSVVLKAMYDISGISKPMDLSHQIYR